MTVATGARARLAFGYEDAFGEGLGAGETWKAFGQGARLTGITPRNNIERVYNIGYREARKLIALRFEGAWGVETFLSNTDWLLAVLPKRTEVDLNGDDTNDHYEYSVDKTVKSMTIEVGFEGDEKVLRTLKGCIVRRCGIGCRVNEAVRVRLDGFYADETITNPTSIEPIEDDGYVFTFADGTLKLNGSELAKIQNVDIDIRTGNEPIYQIGSRTAKDAFPRRFEVDGRFSAVAENDSYIRYLLGLGVEGGGVLNQAVNEMSLELTIHNDSEAFDVSIKVDGVAIDEVGSAIEANEQIMFDVTFVARDVKIYVPL